MTQHNFSDSAESSAPGVHVPLSERPLVADDEKTVISVPESSRVEARTDVSAAVQSDPLRQRLFPANGSPTGDESGVRLAHFEIRQRLGAGGMGAVFRALDLELARDVALKILHPGPSQDNSMVARFRNEARACAQLNHDNIARVFYAGSQDGLYFIAYEFASGCTIRDLIMERGQLSVAETVNYAIQVTLALNHIAAAGVVHRDIKPSNIMLTDTGRVKVVDLGLARRETEDSIGDITVAGTTLGTFDYIAPEQARDPRNADVRSDIYSLGCTMYHMLTGQPPYPEGTALQKLLDHQGKTPPDPRALNPRVSEGLAAIMRKMMANIPEHRYQAAGLLLNDLMRMASMLGLQSVPAEGIVWKKLQAARPATPIGAIWVFASVVAICLTAIFLQRWPLRSGELILAGGDERGEWREVRPENYPPVATAGESAQRSPTTVESTARSADPGSSATGIEVAANTAETGNLSGGTADSGSGNKSVNGVVESGLPLSALPVPIASAAGGIAPTLADLSQLPIPADAVDTARKPPMVAASEQMGPFVLQRSNGPAQSFRTLKAAIADAQSGDVVLLRYNGYPDDLPAQPPVRIVGINLIVRAAEGYRPTLEFDGVAESALTPGQMFSIRNQGSLTIRDLDLRVVVRDDLTADRWSLFHLSGSNRIQLENVSIEVVNPDLQPAVLFDMTDDAQSPGELLREELEIAMTRVICRAQGDAFRVACQPRGRIRLQNCGLALQGRLLELRGDASMQPARGSLEVFTDHVTCLHSGALIQASESDPEQRGMGQRLLPSVSVRSEASVFAVAMSESPLLRSSGSEWLEELESLLVWNGFTNLYSGYSVFWITEAQSLDYASRRLDFAQWKQLWQKRTDGEDTSAELLPDSVWRTQQWKSESGIVMDRINPAAFELNGASFFPGRTGLPQARDGLTPGVNAQELPVFPRRRSVMLPEVSAPTAAPVSGSAPQE